MILHSFCDYRNWTLAMLYQIVLGPPVQYFTFNIAFELGAWFERNPKKTCLSLRQGRIFSLIF